MTGSLAEPIQTVSENEATEWRVYQNEEYGFELPYPREWKIDVERSTSNEVVFDTGHPESREAISFERNTKNISAADWVEMNRKKHEDVILNESKMTVAGVEAYKIETGEFAQSYIVFSTPEFLYVITNMGLIEENGLLERMKLSDWKTYRNNALGFEIKIPKTFKMSQPNNEENYLLFSDGTDKVLNQSSISFEVISYKHLFGKQLQKVDDQSLTNVSYGPYLSSRNIVLHVENRKVNNADVRLFEYQFNEAPLHHSIEAWIEGYKEKEAFFQCKVGVCAIKTFSDNFSLDKEKMFLQILSSLSLIK